MNKFSQPNSLMLIFVEDPGALNGILPIARRLCKHGFNVHIEFDGYAKSADKEETKAFSK